MFRYTPQRGSIYSIHELFRECFVFMSSVFLASMERLSFFVPAALCRHAMRVSAVSRVTNLTACLGSGIVQITLA
jgi:hypothetical protein